MVSQPEKVLEDNLIEQLKQLGYSFVKIDDEEELLQNLKAQIEKHNQVKLSQKDFGKVINHLAKGNVFEKAKTLRDKMQIDLESGESKYIEFINQEEWCQNQFQVTRQVTIEGKYKNRYDVTILINGLPLIQIELKRRGLELKEAFNQINRYQRHSFWASSGLFQYVQIFVISNGVNTKYYANNKKQSFKQTFFWADENNKIITQLERFSKVFLEPCHAAKMITRYIVLNETLKILMVLRPYQYFATKAIIDRVKNSRKFGYIWHTTGSGKTLTSFKTSQILTRLPKIHKVVFVVDRKDLDYQTAKEFNSFSKGCIDGTDNTRVLVKQMTDDTKLIVTTIQKLNNAITKKQFLAKMEPLQSKRMVFIFDECHRSQFGKTHEQLKSFFKSTQMFGFTGTPIFADNAATNELGKRTTKDLFEECLHKYVITDAIRDENVLKFSIEYIGKYKQKEDSKTNLDIKVEEIDKKELLESPVRLEKIVDYIIANHGRKTHSRTFNAMFCVSNIETLIKYYEIFKEKKEAGQHKLKIGTIFSFAPNEEDAEANGIINEELPIAAEDSAAYTVYSHTREKLDAFIEDYNKMFDTKFSTKDSQTFYNYYKDISKKVKDRQLDLMLVVSMFLTGFDSPTTNTLYVDKNLKYHGLIQAYSRTNRIVNEQKSHGNVVCFRNLKQATDEAITLFSNKEAKEVILLEPYEEYVKKFNKAVEDLLKVTPTIRSVDALPSETEELEFIKAFRELMRLKNALLPFSDFSFDDLAMSEQRFEDYKSKYLDLYEKVKHNKLKEKVSILDDVDFELELIHRDEINVAYILKLLAKIKDADEKEKKNYQKKVNDFLSGEAQLRSKRKLIEKFILENLPKLGKKDDVEAEFQKYWNEEQQKAFEEICKQENIKPEKLKPAIEKYLFTERKPLRDEVVEMLEEKPKLLKRKTIVERVIEKIVSFVDTFINGMGED